MKLLSLVLVSVFLGSVLLAQTSAPVQPQVSAQPVYVQSPVVQADGKVAFSLLAPRAAKVEVDGYYPIGKGYGTTKQGTPMIRDEQGVWNVTIGPLTPDFYIYDFIVDGIRVLDPSNNHTARHWSWFIVPGAESDLYQLKDVPHGRVSDVWYPSPTLKLTRRMTVYTPPSYDQGAERYPVLYLLHGGGGDEYSWLSYGRAAQILDNLIAQGKAIPMIVVMTNGADEQPFSDQDRSVGLWQPGPEQHTAFNPNVRFPESLANDVVPFMDQNFRTKHNRECRAVAGLSMGGAQAMLAVLKHLDQFSWAGWFSPGLPLLPGIAKRVPMPSDAALRRGPDVGNSVNADKLKELFPTLNAGLNKQLNLIYFSMGSADGLVEAYQETRHLLDEQGIKYQARERPDYGHDWRMWRLDLADFSSRLFRSAKTNQAPMD